MDGDIGNLIQQLIDLVKSTAPELWRIAMQQVTVNKINSILFAIVGIAFLVFGICHMVYGNKQYNKEENTTDYWDTHAYLFVSILTLVSGFFILIWCVPTFVGYVVNPEYYAIDVLMSLVKQ